MHTFEQYFEKVDSELKDTGNFQLFKNIPSQWLRQITQVIQYTMHEHTNSWLQVEAIATIKAFIMCVIRNIVQLL